MKISNIAIYGSITSLMIAFILPIVLIVVVKKRFNAKLTTLFAGVFTFVFFAIFFESICHSLVLKTFPNIESNIFLYALYGALAAALFEETGRYLTYKFYMKKRMDIGNSMMMGIGHGGIEAFFIVLSIISNVVLLVSYNNGMLETALVGMDEVSKATMMEAIYALGNTEPLLFFLAGIERASAIFLQISLSVLVFYSFKNKKYLLYALGIHFAVDFITVLMNEYVYALSIELTLIVAVSLICYFVYKVHLKENEATN